MQSHIHNDKHKQAHTSTSYDCMVQCNFLFHCEIIKLCCCCCCCFQIVYFHLLCFHTHSIMYRLTYDFDSSFTIVCVRVEWYLYCLQQDCRTGILGTHRFQSIVFEYERHAKQISIVSTQKLMFS